MPIAVAVDVRFFRGGEGKNSVGLSGKFHPALPGCGACHKRCRPAKARAHTAFWTGFTASLPPVTAKPPGMFVPGGDEPV